MAAQYVALRAMTVKTLNADGSDKLDADGQAVYREVKRGDLLPEALHWPNLQLWVQARAVGLLDHFVPDPPAQAAAPAAAAAEARPRARREPAPPAAPAA